jgi:hypothetical protein
MQGHRNHPIYFKASKEDQGCYIGRGAVPSFRNAVQRSRDIEWGLNTLKTPFENMSQGTGSEQSLTCLLPTQHNGRDQGPKGSAWTLDLPSHGVTVERRY